MYVPYPHILHIAYGNLQHHCLFILHPNQPLCFIEGLFSNAKNHPLAVLILTSCLMPFTAIHTGSIGIYSRNCYKEWIAVFVADTIIQLSNVPIVHTQCCMAIPWFLHYIFMANLPLVWIRSTQILKWNDGICWVTMFFVRSKMCFQCLLQMSANISLTKLIHWFIKSYS